ARALAALNFYVSGEDGVPRAQTLLDLHPPSPDDPDEVALHQTVRRAIEDPESVTPAEEQRILDQMAWFGKLLLARGRPSGDPLRKEVQYDSFLALGAMLALVAIGGMGTLAGVVLLIIGLVQFSNGKIRFGFGAAQADASIYLQAFAVGLALFLLIGIALGVAGLAHPVIGLGGMFVAYVIALLWPVLRGVPAPIAARDLGFSRGAGWLREAGAGVVGYLSMLPVVAFGFLLTLVLITIADAIGPESAEGSEVISHPVAVWMAHGNTVVRLGVLFLAAGFAPFFEEALFRGALLRGVRRTLGPISSALIVGFIFAIIHPQGVLVVPALGALGFGFALLREWRGSLIAPMVAHAVHNGALVTFMWIMF
ncbi:MAG: type II CAAX endopeptidase family protein, partial [Acidobacteriota bacterium]|nr:type II CAAX endopeptidase family protein [Acidobacteriota bacterium]